MQNNKVLKRVVETVLVLVVLICGMFCLTACTDEGKISDLNSKIEKLEKQLNEGKNRNNDENQLNNNSELENELMKTKSTLCILNAIADFEKPMTLATNPIERETSSVGLPYEGISSVIAPEEVVDSAYGLLQYKILLECLSNIMDARSFEFGKIYQDSNNSDEVIRKLIIELNAQEKNITGYLNSINGVHTVFSEIIITVNDNFTDWESVVIKTNSEYSNDMVTLVNGKNDGLLFKSYNRIVFEADALADFMCMDLDTNLRIVLSDEMAGYQTEKAFLTNKYFATVISCTTNVRSALTGKTGVREFDFWNL